MVMTVLLPYLTGRAVEAIKHGASHAELHELAARAHDRHSCSCSRSRSSPPCCVRWALTYFRRMIAGRVSLGIEFDLRERLYGHLQRLELGFFDRQQTGQLMSRATVDLQAVRFFLGYGLVFILQSALTLAARRHRDDRDQPGARPDRDGAGAVRRASISQRYGRTRAPGDPGGAAAHRRADRGRRGEHLRRARRQVLRARAATSSSASATASRACSTSRWSPRAWRRRYNPMIGFLPQLGLAAVLLIGGDQRDPRAPHARPVHRVLPVPEHADRRRCARSA